MARYRPIKTCFWSDEWVATLKPTEKLLYLYLITNERTNLCGIYRLPIQYISFETGLNQGQLEKAFQSFGARVMYKNGWVVLKNYKKHQSASPKIQEGIKREESQIPQHIKELAYGIDRVSIGIDKPVLKLKPKLKDISTNVDKASPPAPKKKEYGKAELNKLRDYILQELKLADFTESQTKSRMWLQHLYNRAQKEVDPNKWLTRAMKEIKNSDLTFKSIETIYKHLKTQR